MTLLLWGCLIRTRIAQYLTRRQTRQRAAVRHADYIGIQAKSGIADFLHLLCSILKIWSRFGANRSARCSTNVRDNCVRTYLCHLCCLGGIEDVDDCEEIHVACHANRLDLLIEARSCFLQRDTGITIDNADCWKVIDTIKSQLFELLEELAHAPSWVCTIDSRNDRDFFNNE